MTAAFFPTLWIAWTRTPPDRRWRPVAEGATEAEARQKVNALDWKGCRDVAVLPEGINPNHRKES